MFLLSKQFFHRLDDEIANISVTPISTSAFSIFEEITSKFGNIDGEWYYFNQLFVPVEIRNKGIATKLMNQLEEWADNNKINILNHPHPYGDLNMEALIRLYQKHRFIVVNADYLIRLSIKDIHS